MKLRLLSLIFVFLFLLVSCSNINSSYNIRPEFKEDALNTLKVMMEEFYNFMELPEEEREDDLMYNIYQYKVLETFIEFITKYEDDLEFNKMEAEIYLQLRDLQKLITDIDGIDMDDFDSIIEKRNYILSLLGG